MAPNTGTIFNIQKFSLNDGPGIRTTVFLKGCPLRCRWCANPESQLVRPQLFHDEKKCLHCRRCENVCPEQAISWKDGFQAKPCSGCSSCVDDCPAQALSLEGYAATVDAVMAEVLQDRPFYEESGGGLTLSGGELLAQPAFAKALLKRAREESLDTCIETTGYGDPEVFGCVLAYADHVLFDVKHWDPEKHKEGTGTDNHLILANLRQALKRSDVLVRIPVIPGFNDHPEDALQFARLFQDLGIQRVQLLPFHQFGQNKYGLLHRDYAYGDVKALHEEDLASYQSLFKNHGIEAFF